MAAGLTSLAAFSEVISPSSTMSEMAFARRAPSRKNEFVIPTPGVIPRTAVLAACPGSPNAWKKVANRRCSPNSTASSSSKSSGVAFWRSVSRTDGRTVIKIVDAPKAQSADRIFGWRLKSETASPMALK